MANGYAGKILSINLTKKTITTLDTEKYKEYAGGIGIASAIFWDLAVAPGDWDLKDAYDPRNVISLMSGPWPRGIPVQENEHQRCFARNLPHPPVRTNQYGGRFATMLKQAGWDGVVVQGRRNDQSGSTSSTTKLPSKMPVISGV